MTQRARTFLDQVVEEEVRKDLVMRNWETNGDPLQGQMNQERVKALV
eukprot:CAMPEP_0170562680 /NCGR_PEP_ID=MMETSP0211-20121228/61907_1 /TAXON_ID=311385 /ORGANISM="Pseudokeronopsis sp., Strain OXSARD2" /LENGTH=46 /DNA_ID= /DNA_START= /DNA_END= /DNA_ORIENTATION=